MAEIAARPGLTPQSFTFMQEHDKCTTITSSSTSLMSVGIPELSDIHCSTLLDVIESKPSDQNPPAQSMNEDGTDSKKKKNKVMGPVNGTKGKGKQRQLSEGNQPKISTKSTATVSANISEDNVITGKRKR